MRVDSVAAVGVDYEYGLDEDHGNPYDILTNAGFGFHP